MDYAEAISRTLIEVVSAAARESAGMLRQALEDSAMRDFLAKRYRDHLTTNIGQVRLFLSSRSVFVGELHVELALTSDTDLNRYATRDELEIELLTGERDKARRADAMDCVEALDATVGRGFGLIGGAGSGKTTTFKHVALHCALGGIVAGKARVPLFVPIREAVRSGVGLKDYAIAALQRMAGRPVEQFVDGLLSSGSAILLFDGIDEAPLGTQRRMISEIEELREAYPDVPVCVSARPRALDVELPDFKVWQTMPLSPMQRETLVRNWFADAEAGAEVVLHHRGHPAVDQLCSNPLLACIVCAVVSSTGELPGNAPELYSTAADGLLGRWDTWRRVERSSKLAKLSMYRRRQLVGHLAYYLLGRDLRVFAAADLERSSISSWWRENLRLECDAEEVLGALEAEFSVLVEPSDGLYSFAHLSLQEFLAARWICDHESRMVRHVVQDHFYQSDWHDTLVWVVGRVSNAAPILRQMLRLARMGEGNDWQLLSRCWSEEASVDREGAYALSEALINRIVGILPKDGCAPTAKALTVTSELGVADAITLLRTVLGRDGVLCVPWDAPVVEHVRDTVRHSQKPLRMPGPRQVGAHRAKYLDSILRANRLTVLTGGKRLVRELPRMPTLS